MILLFWSLLARSNNNKWQIGTTPYSLVLFLNKIVFYIKVINWKQETHQNYSLHWQQYWKLINPPLSTIMVFLHSFLSNTKFCNPFRRFEIIVDSDSYLLEDICLNVLLLLQFPIYTLFTVPVFFVNWIRNFPTFSSFVYFYVEFIFNLLICLHMFLLKEHFSVSL